MGSDPAKTPTCPACKAKFAHSNAMECCNKCGLPDEVKNEGPRAIARWKRSKTPRAERRGAAVARGASSNRIRNKHGRKGVKRAKR